MGDEAEDILLVTASDSFPYSSAGDFSLPRLHCKQTESHIEQDLSSTSQAGDGRQRESLSKATCRNSMSYNGDKGAS